MYYEKNSVEIRSELSSAWTSVRRHLCDVLTVSRCN